MKEISGSVLQDLEKYLLAHEDDIYFGINDYGELLHSFVVIVGRQPQEQPPLS